MTAKRDEQVTLKRKIEDPESREFWEFVDRRTDATEKWPEWKKRDSPAPPMMPEISKSEE